MKLIHLREDKAWLYGSPEFYCKLGVVLVAALKCRRCIQDMKFSGFALQTERGRQLKLRPDF